MTVAHGTSKPCRIVQGEVSNAISLSIVTWTQESPTLSMHLICLAPTHTVRDVGSTLPMLASETLAIQGGDNHTTLPRAPSVRVCGSVWGSGLSICTFWCSGGHRLVSSRCRGRVEVNGVSSFCWHTSGTVYVRRMTSNCIHPPHHQNVPNVLFKMSSCAGAAHGFVSLQHELRK